MNVKKSCANISKMSLAMYEKVYIIIKLGLFQECQVGFVEFIPLKLLGKGETFLISKG